MLVIFATSRPSGERRAFYVPECGALDAVDFQVMHNEHAPPCGLTDCLWWVPGCYDFSK